MRSRLRPYRALMYRVFVIFCIGFTLFTLLFDYRSTPYPGISASACQPVYVDAASEGELPQRLVEEFAPTLVFSFGEPAKLSEEVVVPYQIVPDVEETSRYVWRGAVTYRLDYGASAVGIRFGLGGTEHSLLPSHNVLRLLGWIYGQAHIDSHVGDVEMFELYLKPAEAAGYWAIDSLATFPHGTRRTYPPDEFHCFRDSPILYISRGKHAMYPSLEECNNSSITERQGLHLVAEHCSVGELYYPSIAPEFDVGDTTNPVNIFETSPTILANEVFVGEDAWGSCFYGGFGPDRSPEPCRSSFRWW